MDPNKSVPPSKKYIFVDTCIIQDAGDKNTSKSEAVIKFLKELDNEGFSLAISEFMIYEKLQGLWGNKALEASKILGTYIIKQVDRRVLVMASILQGLYYEEGLKDISDGDKIIAATSMLEGGLVLTRDHKGFPNPFFLVHKYIPIKYIVGRHNSFLDYVIYSANDTVIGNRIDAKERLNK